VYFIGTTPVVPKPIFLPSLNERGIFNTGELPTILPNRPSNTTKDPALYIFRILGVLLQRGETKTHGPWCPQTAAIRNRIAAFAGLVKTLPFSIPESKLALSSHFIPKSCFSLSKVFFDIDLIYEVQAICTAVSLSSAGIDTQPNQNIITTAAMVSHNGTFTGIGRPDSLTCILRGHVLHILAALNHPENSASYASFAVPLRQISQHPEGTSFPTIRKIYKLLARFGISLNFGHPSLVIPHAATRSTRAENMSALAAIPKTLHFRALNEKKNRQMLSIPMHLPRSSGPANPKPSLETIRDVVDFSLV
jgi:hypothetical protein